METKKLVNRLFEEVSNIEIGALYICSKSDLQLTSVEDLESAETFEDEKYVVKAIKPNVPKTDITKPQVIIFSIEAPEELWYIDKNIFEQYFVLSDEEYDDVGSEFYDHDGWDEDRLEDEFGLMSWIEGVELLAYELKNARRGSYALRGDTFTDLNQYIYDLKETIVAISENIENYDR